MVVNEITRPSINEINSAFNSQVKSLDSPQKPVEKNQEKITSDESVSKSAQQKLELNGSDLHEAVAQMNKHLGAFNSRLSFSYDRDNEVTVMKIQDRQSGEVIKQFPPEELLATLKKMSDIVGLLVDQSI